MYINHLLVQCDLNNNNNIILCIIVFIYLFIYLFFKLLFLIIVIVGNINSVVVDFDLNLHCKGLVPQ